MAVGMSAGAQPRQRDGREVVLPQKDLQAAVGRLRRHDTSVWEVLRSWRGVRGTATFSVRDPRPGVAHLRQLIAQQVRG